LEQKVLQEVDAVTRRFLWNRRHPCVKLESVQQPRNKGGLGLMPTTMQARALLAKWFACVLNPDEPPWCALARSLLSRHLATARCTLSDLLAGNVSSRQLKGEPTLWHNLLKTWDVLDDGALTNIVVPPNVDLAISASLVFVHTDDDRQGEASKSWNKIGIQ
jgi:hypothetical protein